MPNFQTLQGIVKELCNYKFLKMGQNLHANMEGFRRAGHILQLAKVSIFQSKVSEKVQPYNYFKILIGLN